MTQLDTTFVPTPPAGTSTDREPAATTGWLALDVESFYAEHFALLDSGEIGAWAETFHARATFAGASGVVTGREAIAQETTRRWDRRNAEGIRHRHLPTALRVHQVGTYVHTRQYVLVVEASAAAAPAVHVSSVCEDVLERVDGRWTVRNRTVYVDGVNPA